MADRKPKPLSVDKVKQQADEAELRSSLARKLNENRAAKSGGGNGTVFTPSTYTTGVFTIGGGGAGGVGGGGAGSSSGTGASAPKTPAVQSTQTPARAFAPKPLEVKSAPPPKPTTTHLYPPGDPAHTAIDAYVVVHPEAENLRFRLKPRLDQLLGPSFRKDLLLEWGERNLETLRSGSSRQAQLSNSISQLDATGWTRRATDMTCRPPSFLNRLLGTVNSDDVEFHIKEIRKSLVAHMVELGRLQEEMEPDVQDLRVDIMALEILKICTRDSETSMLTDGRIRTLTAAQSTIAMSVVSLRNMRDSCAQNVNSIDQLLTIAIPNWRLSNGSR